MSAPSGRAMDVPRVLVSTRVRVSYTRGCPRFGIVGARRPRGEIVRYNGHVPRDVHRLGRDDARATTTHTERRRWRDGDGSDEGRAQRQA